jgi:hypothetical protein
VMRANSFVMKEIASTRQITQVTIPIPAGHNIDEAESHFNPH